MAPSQSKHQNIIQAAELTRNGIVLERHNEGEQNGEREGKEASELDARAKEWTPQSKGRRRNAVKVVAATQNVRGLTTEFDREEIKLQMGRQGMHVVCGQETWMQDDKAMKRWDSGELFINCGGQKKGKHEGVCFFLSKVAAKMFERGGRRLKKCCSRLATMRLQMHEGRVSAPISSYIRPHANAPACACIAALSCKDKETRCLVSLRLLPKSTLFRHV